MVREAALKPGSRLQSVDSLRGAIMMLMAVDHVRDFFHSGSFLFSPEDLRRTTAALFFTRWITHFCAPVFMFTAGIGAFLWWQRGRTKRQLSRFLFTRGLWLIFLELTVVRFALTFSLSYTFTVVTVLWALGWCMIALGVAAHLPIRTLAILSVVMVAGHNLLDGIRATQFGAWAWLWNGLHQVGVFSIGSHQILLAYPLIPWIGVMALGFCFGPILLLEPGLRQRRMAQIGLVLTIAFVAIRAINIYGDPAPWEPQRSAVFTVLSFLRCNKYPPSLDFLLMTMGPALLALSWLDRRTLSASNPLIVFGRTPLFYFLIHLFAIHLLAVGLAFITYGYAGFLLSPLPSMGGDRKLFPPDYGYNLPVTWLICVLLVAALYPVCLWYARLKQRRRDWWLSYL